MSRGRDFTIVTFADLGRRRNLKTPDIEPVIERFAREDLLEQVICRMNEGFWFKHTLAAVPVLFHNAVHILSRIPYAHLNVRFLEERIFDFSTSRQMRKVPIVLFHYDYLAPNAIRRAKENGSVTIGMAVTADISYNAKIEEEEFQRLGLRIGVDWVPPYMQRKSFIERKEVCDYIIAYSDFVKKTYIQAGFPADRIFTAILDIDTERFMPREIKEDAVFRVLYISHTSIIKGLHYLLEAWQELKLENSELVVVGGYSNIPPVLEKRYQDSIASDSSIREVDVTKNPEILYNQASIFVFPSLTEGFGRVSIEAMASGIPVVTTINAKGIVEDGKNGFVVPIRDSAALKEKIEYFYRNPQEIRRMGVAARKSAIEKEPFADQVLRICRAIQDLENKKHERI